MWKHTKHENDLPLRIQHHDFGLRIGSRGTPWNSKSAQPGGSENTKCQKVPFKWHFGVFGVLSLFHFSLLHFLILSLFVFLHFLILMILSLFQFSQFCWFWCFCIFDDFCHFFMLWMIFDQLLCQFWVPQSWHTFTLANLHSHYPPFW